MMPRSRIFAIYALLAVVALSAGLLVARTFGSSPNLPTGYGTPTAATSQAMNADLAPNTALSASEEATLAPVATPARVLPITQPTAAHVPAVQPTTEPASGYVEYIVQKGDILKVIAQKYGVTIEDILVINQIPNPDSLNVGAIIRIPKK
jgi:LysM repeat protein